MSTVQVFLRVRPHTKPAPTLSVLSGDRKAVFRFQKDHSSGLINNQREVLEFAFSDVFDTEVQQEQVFSNVARSIVLAALDGVNGTVFAYGQTGSGKTFTMTGGAERYVDRGIIPRTLSLIFHELATRSNSSYSVHISCVEIYNEAAFDLLATARDQVRSLEDLQRVHMLEDAEAHMHLRNLSVHRADTEEAALNLLIKLQPALQLFLADTNRVTSETPMNLASSRSHYLFTITIEARQEGSDLVRKAKLNLVDLAGSERVSRTNSDGMLLKEAKYINLSLHYLEQVIIALQERSTGHGMLTRPHVPYRNSILTAMLKDSLGGNCATAMLATISSEGSQLEESIATCRFAQRVAMITNEVSVNEEVDPALVVERLKVENALLKSELRLLRGEAEGNDVGPDMQQHLQGRIDLYLSDRQAELGVKLDSMLIVQAVIAIMRERFLGRSGAAASAASGSISAGGSDQTLATSSHVAVAVAESSRGSRNEGGTQQHIVEDNRSMYIALCQEAKCLGRAISVHKQEIERSKAAVQDGTLPETGKPSHKEQIEQDTQQYKQAFARLRDLKPQIEQLQALLQRSHTESRDAAPPAVVQDTSRLPVPTAAEAAAAASTDHSELHSQHNISVSLEQPERAAAAEDQMLPSASAEQAPERQPAAAPQPAVVDGIPAARQTASLAPFALPEGANGFRSSRQEQDQPAATAAEPRESQGAAHVGHTEKHGYRWGGTRLLHRANEGAAGSQKQVPDDFSHVDPEIMAQAKPLLTGNVVADRNIVRFYEARANCCAGSKQARRWKHIRDNCNPMCQYCGVARGYWGCCGLRLDNLPV